MRVVVVVALVTPVSGCGGGRPTSPMSPTPEMLASPCGAIAGTTGGVLPIVNGAACDVAASVVLLDVRDAADQSQGNCSGTIIAPRAVLTAGHCLQSPATRVRVSFGTGGPVHEAVSFAASHDYLANPESAVDVGVLLVAEDLPRRAIPVLFARDARVGEDAIIAGWGLDENRVGTQLKAGRTVLSGITDFLESDFAASSASLCQGDSGGPLLVQEGGVWSLAGVASGGSTSACDSGTSYFAIVRNPAAMAFVLELVPNAARR